MTNEEIRDYMIQGLDSLAIELAGKGILVHISASYDANKAQVELIAYNDEDDKKF